jgi:tetratricopeptide (TPR) repeat protein
MFLRLTASFFFGLTLVWGFDTVVDVHHPHDHRIISAAQAQVWPDISQPDVQFIFLAESLFAVGLDADARSVYAQEIERLEQQEQYDRAILVLILAGDEHRLRGDLDHALRYYQQALSLLEFSAEEAILTYDEVINTVGQIHSALEQYDLALAIYQKSLVWSRVSAEPWLEARTFTKMGIVHQYSGQIESAIAAYQEAVSIYQQFDPDSPEVSRVFNRLGLVYQQQGRREDAIAAYQQALEVSRQTETETPVAQLINQILTLENLSDFNHLQGEETTAQHYSEAAVKVLGTLSEPDVSGVPRYPAELAFEEIGTFYLEANQRDRAQHYFDRAVAIAQDSRNQGYAELNLLSSIILTCTKQGQLALALPYQQQTITVLQHMGLSEHTASSLRALANLYQELGQFEAALATYQEAIMMYEVAHENQDSSVTSIAHIWQQIGAVYETQGKLTLASDAYLQALAQYQQSHVSLGQIAALERLVALHEKQSHMDQAQTYEQRAIALRREAGLHWEQGK